MGPDNTLDWITAISTAAAAVGTLAAVLATLYFNVWRPGRKQPRLALDFIEDSEFGVSWTPGMPHEDDYFGLSKVVRNSRGRRTAQDVQVLVSIGIELDDGDWHDHYSQQPLLWKGGQTPRTANLTTSIPPGVGRQLFTLFIGEPNAVWRQLLPHDDREPVADADTGQELVLLRKGAAPMPIAAAVAIHPMTKEDVVWVYRLRRYRFRFVLTARDVDAVTYESFLTFTFERRKPSEFHGTHWLQPHWTDLRLLEPEDNG